MRVCACLFACVRVCVYLCVYVCVCVRARPLPSHTAVLGVVERYAEIHAQSIESVLEYLCKIMPPRGAALVPRRHTDLRTGGR